MAFQYSTSVMLKATDIGIPSAERGEEDVQGRHDRATEHGRGADRDSNV